MPRTRGKRARYVDPGSSSDEDAIGLDAGLGIVSALLGMYTQSRAKGKSKRNSSHSSTCNCRKTPKRKNTSQAKGKGRGAKAAKSSAASTSQQPSASLNIDTDDEDDPVSVETTQKYTSLIKNKVDTFFKSLESDDDEPEVKPKTQQSEIPEKKSKDFYTLLSESDDEEKNTKSVDTSLSSSVIPCTSGSTVNSELKSMANTVNINSEKKKEDLFAYVDEILNECSEVLDLTEDIPKENQPILTLEDLKKKTDEILDGVASCMDSLKPKPKEPERANTDPSANEAPCCPVCLETLGVERQAMATLCGHMFCEPCLVKVVQTTKKCPSCRKGLTKTKYHPIYL